jgi:hypothetical protein
MKALFDSISWTNLALLIVAAYIMVTLWQWNHDKRNVYDVRDLLLDHATNRASVDKHIVAGFAVLSGWVVVTWTLEGKNVETLLLGVLGIFIVQRAASKVTDAFIAKRDDPVRPTVEVDGEAQVRKLDRG